MVVLRRIYHFASYSILILFSAMVRQAAAFPVQYTLRDLEALALQRDAGVAALREKVNEARGELAETRSSYGPELTSYYSRYPTGGNLPEEEENVQHWFSMGVRQDIIQFLKVRPGRIREMDAGVESAEEALKEAESKSLYGLRCQYLDMVEEEIKTDFYISLTAIYQELFEVQNTRYNHQTALLPDLLEAQKEQAEAESALHFHQQGLARQRALLANWLGVGPEEIAIEPLDVPQTILEEEKLIDLALENRGEIHQLEAYAQMERARASTSAYDDIRLSSFLGYRLRDDRLSSTETGLGIGLTFSMPLQFRGIKNNRYQRFSARGRYWQSEAERTRQEIKREIHRAYSDFMLEQSRHDDAVKSVALTTERLRIERLNLENPVRGIGSDLAIILKLKVDLATNLLEKKIRSSGTARSFYELLYLVGLSQPEEMASGVTEMTLHGTGLWDEQERSESIDTIEASWDESRDLSAFPENEKRSHSP